MKKAFSILSLVVLSLLAATLSSTPVQASGKVAVKTASLLSPSSPIGPLPSIGAGCGVGSTIVGTDTKFVVTVGDTSTSLDTSCTVNFGTPYTTQPACFYSNDLDASGASVAPTTSNVTIAQFPGWTLWSGSKMSVFCVQ